MFSRFPLAVGLGLPGVGCLLRATNITFYLKPPSWFDIAGIGLTYGDVLGIVWIAVDLGLYVPPG